MGQFLEIALSFPTIIFSVLLTIMVAYWLTGIIGVIDVDHHVDHQDGGFSHALVLFGLRGLPITLVITLLSFLAWFSSLLLADLLSFLMQGWVKYLIGTFIAITSIFIALPLTGIVLKPLRRHLMTHTAIEKGELVGRTCIVNTLKVTQTFGQASVEDGGAGLIIAIRSDEPNSFKKGSKAVLISYNGENDFYKVVSEQALKDH